MLLTVDQVIEATGGTLLRGDLSHKVRSVVIDSRSVKPGSLFIAIKGERFDGHDFLKQAFLNGAQAVIVSRRPVFLNQAGSVIRVDDTVRALGLLARFYREQFRVPVIAITGSAGKTTTKEMVASALSCRYKVLKNQGSENNQIGVPMTLLKLKPGHQVAVLELGTNRPGDIAWLASLVKPTIAVFTNIGASHLALLKSPAKVFREKSQMLKYMPDKARVIYNSDDAFLRGLPLAYKSFRYISYGMIEKADYQALKVKVVSGRSVEFYLNGRIHFKIGLPILEHVMNILVSIICSRLLHISYNNINTKRIKMSSERRQQFQRRGRSLLIDDSYNANPVSFKSAIRTLSLVEGYEKKVMVCADMLELGSRAAALHRQVGRWAADCGIEHIFTYGRHAQLIGAVVKRKRPGSVVFHCPHISDLNRRLVKYLGEKDCVLVKGSRGMHLEETVRFLNKHWRRKKA